MVSTATVEDEVAVFKFLMSSSYYTLLVPSILWTNTSHGHGFGCINPMALAPGVSSAHSLPARKETKITYDYLGSVSSLFISLMKKCTWHMG